LLIINDLRYFRDQNGLFFSHFRLNQPMP